MKLNHLRDFIAVAETGSLRSAARKLQLTQPALTKSIRLLEQELGAPLFLRLPRGSALTPAGEAFLIRARAALSELRRGHEEVAEIAGATLVLFQPDVHVIDIGLGS